MRTIRKRAHGRPLRTLTMALVLLAALLLAGAALAAGPEGVAQSAKPGKPTAKAPVGAITEAKPTFKWSKASGAAKYELRVYQGNKLQLKKTGITKTSWQAVKALPTNVGLTWKVRAGNAGGAGAWSKSLKFKTVPLKIGDHYQGGIVAYILRVGDLGYVDGESQGLIAAAADQSGGAPYEWSNITDTIGATAEGMAIGTGQANTTAIVGQLGCTRGAAKVCDNLILNTFADWYLPSKDELNQLYVNRVAIGSFASAGWLYWSSSEGGTYHARAQGFSGEYGGAQYGIPKPELLKVRAVRSF